MMILPLFLCFAQLIFNTESSTCFIKKHKHRHIRYFQPEQIHIAFGENPQEIVVTWSTFSKTPQSIVEYGEGKFNQRASGYAKLFVDGGSEKRGQYIHRVRLSGLKPLTQYVYHCGSENGWSEEFWFTTVDNGTDWKPRLALFGDMGNKNARSLPRLQTETQNKMYDAMIHIGDFAYDMRDDNGRVGDQFMRQLQPIAAYIPYMVSPGNHEEAYNFSHYRERFSMPGTHENLYYSFNLGPIHFISFNTEAYYYIEYGLKLIVNQFVWIENDLMEANKPENRKKQPWIIAYGHKPMYCSGDNHEDCKAHSTRVRTGSPVAGWFGLEKLFYEQGVDILFSGHEHSYERLWPLYDYEVKNGTRFAPYTNPKATVHIITGSAGCQEKLVNFTTPIPQWTAFRSKSYGYTVLEAHNKTHLHLQQISVDEEEDIIDDVWIISEKHGNFENK